MYFLGNGTPMSISLKGRLDFNRIARHTFIHLPFSPKTSLLTQGLWNPLESIRYVDISIGTQNTMFMFMGANVISIRYVDIFHWHPKLNVCVYGCQCNINKICRYFPLAPKTQCLCLWVPGCQCNNIKNIFRYFPLARENLEESNLQ